MGYVLVKGIGEGAGVGVGATPGGLSPLLTLPTITGFQDKFPDKELRERYGYAVEDEEGKATGQHEYYPEEDYRSNESIDNAARSAHKWGNRARYGIAGLAGLNALYNQTASGQPGILAPTLGGAYTGFAASSGLGPSGAKYAAARENRRLQRNPNWETINISSMRNEPTQIAEPTQADPRYQDDWKEQNLLGMGHETMEQDPGPKQEQDHAVTALRNEMGDPTDLALEAIRRNMGG